MLLLDELLFNVKQSGNEVEVGLTNGSLGIDGRQAFEQLGRIVEEANRPSLRIDMTEVDFLTGSGIGRLVRVRNQVKEKGGEVSLHRVSPAIKEVFRVVNLTGMFGIEQVRK